MTASPQSLMSVRRCGCGTYISSYNTSDQCWPCQEAANARLYQREKRRYTRRNAIESWACARCGRSDRPHRGRGLCTACYRAELRAEQRRESEREGAA